MNSPNTPASVVFLDSRVALDEFALASFGPNTQLIPIDNARDGLSQMAEALRGMQGVQSIQVISHGGPGTLLLGASAITANTLNAQSALLKSIGTALTPGGDLLLYGCSVAQGEAGERFVALLAELTSADVAASVDLTGAHLFDANWTLEYATGTVETSNELPEPLRAAISTLPNFSGTPGNDTLIGGAENDTISGDAGSDSLVGNAGDDLLIGGPGNDVFNPGDGNDTIDGGIQSRVPWVLAETDWDSLDYYSAAGTQIDLSTRTVTVSGLTGVDTYSGIETIWGGFNTTDIVTGRTSDSVHDYEVGGNVMALYLRGGSDTVSLTGYGYQQPLADGVYVYHNWSATGLNVTSNQNVIHVNYGASGSQVAGTDTLINVGLIGDSRFNDYIDLSAHSINHFGYITAPYADRSWNFLLMGYGGSDTIVGSGSTSLHYNVVTHSSNGLGVNLDLKTGQADLSHLSTSGTPLGAVTFSGVYGLNGTRFADTLIGGVDDRYETFRGYGGNDFIDGGTGYDRVDYSSAGEGIQFVLRSGLVSSLSEGEDTLRGIEEFRTTKHDDTYDATGLQGGFTSSSENVVASWWAFNAFIENGGNDLIIGNGSTRIDYINSLVGINANLSEGFVDARLEADKLNPLLYSMLGRDTISGISQVAGSSFDDLIVGGDAGWTRRGTSWEFFRGNAGNDTIDGLAGPDISFYSNSPNAIVVDMRANGPQVLDDGFGFSDTLISIEAIGGSAYADSVRGSDDPLAGLAFYGGRGQDSLDGGIGSTRITYWDDPGAVEVRLQGWVGGAGMLPQGFTGSGRDAWGDVDLLVNVRHISGSNYNDTLQGDDQNNTIDPWGGHDYADGGQGTDTIEFRYALQPVHVNLAAGRVYDDGQGYGTARHDAAVEQDTIVGFENVRGGQNNDTLIGDAGANEIWGDTGDDILTGAGANDTLHGGDGIDAAVFNGLASEFVYNRLADGSFIVQDTVAHRNGTDTLNQVEFLRFSDRDIPIADLVSPWFYFGNSKYALVRGPTWYDAKVQAEALKGHLVTIASEGENQFIAQTFADYSSQVWLGLNDFNSRSNWEWLVDEGTPYFKWYNNPYFGPEPNDVSGFERATVMYLVPEPGPLASMPSHWNNADPLINVFGVVEVPLPTTPESIHRVYHWKSHMLLSGVQIGNISEHGVGGDNSLFDVREARYDATTGVLTMQLWSTSASARASFDFRVDSPGATSASFQSALPGSWSVLSNTATPSTLSVGGFDANITGFTGATQLGTLTLHYPPGSNFSSLNFHHIAIGTQSVNNLALSFSGQITGPDGGFTLPDDGSGSTVVQISRSTADIGNAVTSADALAALRIAVGLNPNTDPDGTGPLQPLRLSPYQVMAADANGSGRVTAADALEVLKMAVNWPGSVPDAWFFVEETRDFWNEATQQYTLTRDAATWDPTVIIDASATTATGVVGVLKGDVNGSWQAPAGSIDLDVIDPNYFTNLAARMNVPTDQWGV